MSDREPVAAGRMGAIPLAGGAPHEASWSRLEIGTPSPALPVFRARS
jgi:hypothetical protein